MNVMTSLRRKVRKAESAAVVCHTCEPLSPFSVFLLLLVSCSCWTTIRCRLSHATCWSLRSSPQQAVRSSSSSSRLAPAAWPPTDPASVTAVAACSASSRLSPRKLAQVIVAYVHLPVCFVALLRSKPHLASLCRTVFCVCVCVRKLCYLQLHLCQSSFCCWMHYRVKFV